MYDNTVTLYSLHVISLCGYVFVELLCRVQSNKSPLEKAW